MALVAVLMRQEMTQASVHDLGDRIGGALSPLCGRLEDAVVRCADWQIVGDLSWNVLFSAEWEWHDNSIENNQIYLLSSGLSYTF